MICKEGCVYWDGDTCGKEYMPEDEDNCIYYTDIHQARSKYWRSNYGRID